MKVLAAGGSRKRTQQLVRVRVIKGLGRGLQGPGPGQVSMEKERIHFAGLGRSSFFS